MVLGSNEKWAFRNIIQATKFNMDTAYDTAKPKIKFPELVPEIETVGTDVAVLVDPLADT